MPMTHPMHVHRWLAIALIGAMTIGTAGAQADAPANLVDTSYPSEADPGAPFYVRMEPSPPHLYIDGGYAIVVFYRAPGGIPRDFDLLGFFDPPAAFGVESLVAGTNRWHDQPGIGSPYMSTGHGLGAVPIWLVPAEALASRIASTGRLTVSDLEEIDGVLVGHADVFDEVLNPHPLPPEMGGGGHPHPSLTLNASGTLEDGRRFEVTLAGEDGPDGSWQRTASLRFP